MESGFLPESRKISIGQSLQRWLALLIEYFELKIRLLGPESKEAGLHVLGLALLLVSTLTLFEGFLVMLVIFFLFLPTLLFWLALGVERVGVRRSVIDPEHCDDNYLPHQDRDAVIPSELR
jgi:hypothetical protein